MTRIILLLSLFLFSCSESTQKKSPNITDVKSEYVLKNYVDDIKLPGMLFGDFVRSPYAHARVKSINTEAALAVPGVHAVITAADLEPLKLHWMPTLAGDVQMVLADGKVLFQGQEVAFVVADNRYAADDGIKDQTIEAINHAKAAKTPIIVAVNKCDKPEADPTKVKTELLSYEIIPEDMGGDTQVVNVSAITGDGINELIEAIILQSEILELKSNANRNAEGVVIESKMDRKKGSVATILVRSGSVFS